MPLGGFQRTWLQMMFFVFCVGWVIRFASVRSVLLCYHLRLWVFCVLFLVCVCGFFFPMISFVCRMRQQNSFVVCLIRYLNHCRTDAVKNISPPPNQLKNSSGTRSDCVASCVQNVTCFPSCIHMTQQYIQKQNRKLSWQCWETDLYTCLPPAHTGCVWCDPHPNCTLPWKETQRDGLTPTSDFCLLHGWGPQWWGTFVPGEGNKWHR